MKKINLNPGGSVFNRMVQHLAYADDVALISRSAAEAESAFMELEEGAATCGLQINTEKDMVTTSRTRKFGDLLAGPPVSWE